MNYYTNQVLVEIGVSQATLGIWGRRLNLVPKFDNTMMLYYTDDDLSKLRDYKEIRRG